MNCSGHNPFVSCIGPTGFMWTQHSLSCVVLESSKSHLPQGVALFERHLGIDLVMCSLNSVERRTLDPI